MSEQVNIAIIAGQLVVGGAERQLYLWLSNLDREKFNPIVLTLHPGHNDYWEKPVEDLGIPLFRVARRGNRLVRFFDILKVIKPHSPQLIHGWHLFSSPYAGLAAKWIGAKSLGGIRSNYQLSSSSLESKLTMMLCDGVVVNSKTSYQLLQKARKQKKPRLYVVQNALEVQFHEREKTRAYLTGEYQIPGNAIWIGSMGRMYPSKRFDLLLQVLSLVKKDFHNFHVILIGDGPERGNLEDLAKTLSLAENITFTGEVPNASRWLKAFDIFAFTSVTEGLPNVIMEAAAAGLPVVAWKLPFIEEVVADERSALLVECGNIKGMKAVIEKLINSPGLYTRLSKAAEEHTRSTFSLENYIKNMSAVYESLLLSSNKSGIYTK